MRGLTARCSLVILCAVLLAAALTGQAWAQPATSGDAGPVDGLVSALEDPASNEAALADALVRVLDDPAARARLLQALRSKSDTASAPSENAPEVAASPPHPATLNPFESESPGDPGAIPEPAATQAAEQLSKPSSLITKTLTEVRLAIAGLFQFAMQAIDVHFLWGWVKVQAKSAETREFWVTFLTTLLTVVAGAGGSYAAVRLALTAPVRRLRRQAQQAAGARRWRLAATIVPAELAPIAAFTGVGIVLVDVLDFPLRTHPVASTTVWLAASALLGIALARIVLRPQTPNIRLAGLTNTIARDVHRWVQAAVLWLLFGFTIFGSIDHLGVPNGVFEGLKRLWGLVLVWLAISILWRYRAGIGDWIRGSGGRLALLRRFIAEIWLIVAVLYAISAYFVWALSIYRGAELLLRGGLLSILILLAVQPLHLIIRRWLDGVASPERSGRSTLLRSRYRHYAGGAHRIVSAVLYGAAALAIAYAWGLKPLRWLSEYSSGGVVTTLSDIALVGLVCWVLWEGFALWQSAYMGATDETGVQLERSARSRTLLPLLRTLVVVLLAIVFIVATLTSFGLDVAPLLATAGVVGIAVGFGAQKLVQDVITGLFILFQNTISVGDVVELGGLSGTVERMTVRTLELRNIAGSLHTIPFSSVSTVTNLTREFAFALFDIGVAYKEDADEVMEVLKQVGAEFETDPTHGPDLLSALEMFGVQALADNAVTIRCRFRVRPLTQFAISRAFLARVKRRFDELGIEIPFPQRTLHWGGPLPISHPAAAGDSTGNAEPAEPRAGPAALGERER